MSPPIAHAVERIAYKAIGNSCGHEGAPGYITELGDTGCPACWRIAEDVARALDAAPVPDGWEETARQYARNTDYYRGLVKEIGALFGVAARTADDGGISEDVLCAKVPELVRALMAPAPPADAAPAPVLQWECPRCRAIMRPVEWQCPECGPEP